jgi:hypothetical protein
LEHLYKSKIVQAELALRDALTRRRSCRRFQKGRGELGAEFAAGTANALKTNVMPRRKRCGKRSETSFSATSPERV